MSLPAVLANLHANRDVFRDAMRAPNVRVLLSLLGPAIRGFLRQAAKGKTQTRVESTYDVQFDWTYARDAKSDFSKLYTQAKQAQWNGDDLAWSTNVDPLDLDHDLMPEERLPFAGLPQYRNATPRERADQKHAYLSWTLSQFLHGEQGALFAAAQVTTAVQWLDGKLYGSTQVVDEGRHVEVFHRYLVDKLQKKYEINDNLYVILDALSSDSRWDIKFLGMQIMIEGLALGAFGHIRQATKEPLLKELLRYVITDEARHVHYGVLALEDCYTKELSARELRERQDWAFEMSLLLRNRFLLQEFYDEYYAHAMSRDAWQKYMMESEEMRLFRQRLFKRIIPNLKRCGLLPDRLRPEYEKIGLLQFEAGKAAPDLTADDLLAG